MRIKVIFLSIFALFVSWQFAQASDHTESLTEVTYSFADADWYPIFYNTKASTEKRGCLEYEGLFLELLDEMFNNRLKIELQCQTFPWKRAQFNVKNGLADFIVTVPTEPRLKYAIKSKQPIFQLYMHVYSYSDHPLINEIKAIKTVKDIVDLKLVTVTNLGNGWHKENIEVYGIPTYYTKNDEHMLKFLAAKRADIIIDAAIPTNYNIKKLGLSSQIDFTEVRFGPLNFHLLMSKQSKASMLMPAIDETIQSMTQEGYIEQITEKYLLLE